MIRPFKFARRCGVACLSVWLVTSSESPAWQNSSPESETDQLESAPAADAVPQVETEIPPSRGAAPARRNAAARTPGRDRNGRATAPQRGASPANTPAGRDRGRDSGWANRARTPRAERGTRPPEERSGESERTDLSNTSGYAAFRMIADRNIFNTQRTARSRTPRPETPRPSRSDQFTLVGTLTYDKGPFAFFDGTSSEYRKVLQAGQSLAGHKIVAIMANTVRLERGATTLEVTVGDRIRRQGNDWALEQIAPREISPSSNSSDVASASADEEEVLKRLMRQREDELK